MSAHHWMLVAALVVAAVAAWTDIRTGEIPNRVTLVPLALAPFVHAGIAFAAERSARAAFVAAGASLLGAAVCLLIPLALFRVGAIGGGDTKLFAAIGAIGRPEFGVHAETYAFVLGMVYALALVFRRGKLSSTLGNVGAIFRGAGRVASPTTTPEMTQVRFGPAILAGVMAAAFTQWSLA